eukprot:TRINITY_DN3520_c0_g1_i1.p1 TRINITY_DN3520_c0_g1~~TRINITY_DN3520_c0_g1_i1.p1  ORF type:complete len:243 (+),score=26.95 TRINITY_DN3520_c0_g1_i1:23-751(+)
MKHVSFDYSSSRLITKFGSFKDVSYEKFVARHWFNRMMEVVLPDSESVPLHSNQFYHVCLSLSDIVEPNFLQNYIKKGFFLGLSICCKLDTENVIAIYGGEIMLSLDKDTYEQLGLTGTAAKYPPKGNRFIVRVNMLASSFIPGKPLYERVKWCFSDRTSPVHMLVSWTVEDQGENPLFPPKTIKVVDTLSEKLSQTAMEVLAPLINVKSLFDGDKLSTPYVTDLFNWIGCVLCRLQEPQSL